VSAFTLKAPLDIDALTEPLTILFNSKPVTPDAGMLYKPEPSPTKAPLTLPEPVISPFTFKAVPLYVNPL
jgi:hypothetical protein